MLSELPIPSQIIAAIDINPTANAVYSHNFPDTQVLNRNIQFLNEKFIQKHEINTILMSPPCQPFTRVGKQLDNADKRTDGLMHICELIPKVQSSLKWILMENVKGFEKSKSRDLYIECLKSSGFYYQEFLVSPNSFGIPNSRTRYYCIARKNIFEFGTENQLLEEIPNNQSTEMHQIREYLDKVLETPPLLSDDVIKKHANIMDIVYSDSKGSTCFTKAYTRYIEGTGSVYSHKSREEVDVIFKNNEDENFLNNVKQLQLRFFTPKEVARLMCFPESFDYPEDVTEKQKYRLLGNSLNVFVVKKLLQILFDDRK